MVIAGENLPRDYGFEFGKIKKPTIGIRISANADLQTVVVSMEIITPAINFTIGGFGQILSKQSMGRFEIQIICDAKHNHLY